MSKILVVCFSRTGSTRTAAHVLAGRLNAEFDELRAAEPFRGAGGFVRGVLHSLRRATPDIDLGRNPAGYALVVLAAPVWAGRLASPMRTYLARHGRQIRSDGALSVSGRGAAFPQFFAEIEQLTGQGLQARLALSQRQVLAPDLTDRLEPFAMRLLAAAEAGPTPAVRPGSHAA